MEYKCTMCPYITRYHKDFCNHIVRIHKNDPRFLVCCQVGQCCFSTKSWKSYKQHISSYHRTVGVDRNHESIDDENDVNIIPNNEAHDVCQTCINASYLLCLETKHNLSQTAINVVAENTSELIRRHIEMHKKELKSQIQVFGHQNIEQILNDGTVNCFFDDLKSEHRRGAFHEKKLK